MATVENVPAMHPKIWNTIFMHHENSHHPTHLVFLHQDNISYGKTVTSIGTMQKDGFEYFEKLLAGNLKPKSVTLEPTSPKMTRK